MQELLATGGYATINSVGNFHYPLGVAVDRSGNTYIANFDSVVKLTTGAVNFGTITVGQTSATFSLTFEPDTEVKLGAPAVMTQGATGLDFADAGNGTCGANGSGYVYSAGETCTVNVKFSPRSAGAQNGAVVLKDSNGNAIATAYVYGIGSAPMVAFGPGTITTVAGVYAWNSQYGFAVGGYSGDGGPATSAQLYGPEGTAIDGSGNLFIADTYNNVVRKIAPGGIITTIAGTYQLAAPPSSGPVGGYGGDGGPATSAKLNVPKALAVDGMGNLYIADSQNNVVRKVTPGGTITTVAGNYYHPGLNYGYSGDGGPATNALFHNPTGVAVDGAGNLYIADYENEVIRKVTLDGTITTVVGKYQYDPSVGSGKVGYSGDGGPATSAQLNSPFGIAVDGVGNLYIADSLNHLIRKVTPSGTITTVAGTYQLSASNGYPVGGFSGDGGPATSARLGSPMGMAVDTADNLYIVEFLNNTIRKVDVSDAPSLTFPSTYVGMASAPQDVTVLNLGNAPLTINQISTAANFSLGGSDTSCSSSGQVLNPAASCVLGIEFSPMAAGSIGGSIVLTDNALNASSATQSITMQGAASLAPTTLTITTAPTAAPLGGTTQLTALVSSTVTGTITGSVTFQMGSTILGTVPVSGGVATLNNVAVSLANGFSVGSDSITASYSGDASFAVSSGSVPLTVLATTSTTVTTAPPTLIFGVNATLTATVSSATAGAVSGSVTFKLGSTTLGTAPSLAEWRH